MNLKEELLDILEDSETVLVLGNGLNIQAAHIAGGTAEQSWSDLLVATAKDLGVSTIDVWPDSSSPILWEQLANQAMSQLGKERQEIEKLMAESLCQALTAVESSDDDPSGLYAQIMSSKYQNIISFNVDRRLIQHLDASRLEDNSSDYPFLYRKWQAKNTGEKWGPEFTHIWFPYGDSSDPTSIQLGLSSYDARFMGYEDFRKDHMEEWFMRDEEAGYFNYDELHPPVEVYESLIRGSLSRGIKSWFDILFLAPLVFVGTSLSLDDWPLWWLMHQRERNFVPFSEDQFPKAYYLTSRERPAAHLVGRPAGLEVVEFETFDALWTFLRGALRSTSHK